MDKLHHPLDVRLIENIIKNAGIKTYLIDDQTYPEAFEKCTIRFLVDAKINSIVQIFQDKKIIYLNNKQDFLDGFLKVIGPKHKSLVTIDMLYSIKNKEIGEELLTALEEEWAIQWFWAMKDNRLLKIFFPELQDTVNLEGGNYHQETVFEHLMRTLKAAKKHSTKLKLAALLHDIGKPSAYQTSKDQKGKIITTFHNHEVIGATIAFHLCKRLEIPPSTTKYVVKLIRNHMFHFPDFTKDKTIRKWLFKMGKNDYQDLFKLRLADRKGNKANKNKPIITKEFEALNQRVEEIINDKSAVFKEDLAIERHEIEQISSKKQTDPNLISSVLIGLVNQDLNRNNYKWLKEYVTRIYG